MNEPSIWSITEFYKFIMDLFCSRSQRNKAVIECKLKTVYNESSLGGLSETDHDDDDDHDI